MSFLVKSDFENSIRSSLLGQITNNDDAKIAVAISYSEAFMKGYLNARYDVDAIFALTGNKRHPTIVMYGVIIGLYRLHSLVNPVKIPEQVKLEYQEAKEWFFFVSEQKINPTDLPLLNSKQKDYILTGSNPKRENHVPYFNLTNNIIA